MRTATAESARGGFLSVQRCMEYLRHFCIFVKRDLKGRLKSEVRREFVGDLTGSLGGEAKAECRTALFSLYTFVPTMTYL